MVRLEWGKFSEDDLKEVSLKIAYFMYLYTHKECTTKFIGKFNVKKHNILNLLEEILYFIIYLTEYSFWRMPNNPFNDNDVLFIMSKTLQPVATFHYGRLSGNDNYDVKKIEKLIVKDDSKIEKVYTHLRKNFLNRKKAYQDCGDPMESDTKALLFQYELMSNLLIAGGISSTDEFAKIVADMPVPFIDEVSEYLMSTIFTMYKK